MRLAALFLLCTAAFAQGDGDTVADNDADTGADDAIARTLERFEGAKTRAPTPGGSNVVEPALVALAATRDARVLEPMLRFYREIPEMGEELRGRLLELQQTVAKLQDRATEISLTVERLRQRERAGDKTVGPKIQQALRDAEIAHLEFENAKLDVERTRGRTIYLDKLRDIVMGHCGAVIGALDGPELTEALTALRQRFDLEDRDDALALVRILGDCRRAEAEPLLAEIVASKTADAAVVRAAIYAIIPVLGKVGGRALLERWRSEPELYGALAKHALSAAARRRIDDHDVAVKWVESLG
jgi:hypothetical protein